MNFEGATSRISTLTGGRLPPPTDLDGLAERFKKRGYSPVGIDSYRVVFPPVTDTERLLLIDEEAPLKDQKIALLEQRVANLEKENDLLKQYE